MAAFVIDFSKGAAEFGEFAILLAKEFLQFVEVSLELVG